MHVDMGKTRLSLWSYDISRVFKGIQLSFDIYKVFNHHLVNDIKPILCRLHHLYTL